MISIVARRRLNVRGKESSLRVRLRTTTNSRYQMQRGSESVCRANEEIQFDDDLAVSFEHNLFFFQGAFLFVAFLPYSVWLFVSSIANR